jgi:hypothetical protein
MWDKKGRGVSTSEVPVPSRQTRAKIEVSRVVRFCSAVLTNAFDHDERLSPKIEASRWMLYISARERAAG